MSVNVSAHQLMTPGFVGTVERTLATTDTRAGHLCLEVTESCFVHDAKRALAVLSKLKQLGVFIALDDFGTGYSSLSYLRQFPVDIIKIDQSFIADLTENGASPPHRLKDDRVGALAQADRHLRRRGDGRTGPPSCGTHKRLRSRLLLRAPDDGTHAR